MVSCAHPSVLLPCSSLWMTNAVLGLIIGALFTQFVSWRWVFWFNSCAAIPISLACVLLIPASGSAHHVSSDESWVSRIKRLDIIDVTGLTVAVLLFIFAVTSASTTGWGSARVLAPLILSIVLAAAVLVYETRIPVDRASL